MERKIFLFSITNRSMKLCSAPRHLRDRLQRNGDGGFVVGWKFKVIFRDFFMFQINWCNTIFVTRLGSENNF